MVNKTEQKCIVYALSHPDTNEIRYIGQTIKTIERRFSCHLCKAKSGIKWPVYDWIRKLLKNNKIPKIFVISNNAKWNETESIYIKHFKSIGFRLLNITLGGGGQLGMKHSKKSIEKMRLARKGKPSPMKGKKASIKTRQKQRLAKLGKAHPHTDEWDKKIGLSQIGEKNHMAKLTWKIVNSIRKDFKNGMTQVNIAKKYNIDPRNINKIVRNKRWAIQ